MSSSYLDFTNIDKAAHIWRYTPWKKAHPTGTINDIPQSNSPEITMSLADGSSIPEGISIEQATDSDIERLGHELDFDQGTAAPKFIAAIAQKTMILKLENKIKIESPLIVTISTSGNICASRLLIDIGNQVEAEIITVVEGDAKWTGILREGNYGSNAIINDVVTQITGNRLVRCDALSLGRDAQVKAGTVNASSSQAKIDIRHWLNEPGSSLKVNGSILSSNENHLDSHIEITHTGRQTYSRLEWHSACGGKSNTTGTGMLRIDAGAKGADAGQLFHNLLLSEKAKANSIPELEVLESEVVGCGHGTANGPIDEQQLFYLSTRGFNEEQARAALIAAFLNTPLSDMGSDHLHGWLIKRIEKHLNLI
ncbi:MAG: hypothetical protein CMB17_01325 [Euryarchaeota archaeon]|nr:hypothetical protein [Euryarchaeota archaeon]